MDETTADRILQHVGEVRRLQFERERLEREVDLARRGEMMRIHAEGLLDRLIAAPDSAEAMADRAAQYRALARGYMQLTLLVRAPDPQVAAAAATQIADLIETAGMWERRASGDGPPRVHGCSHRDAAPNALVVCVHGMACARCFRAYCEIGQIIALAEQGGAQ